MRLLHAENDDIKTLSEKLADYTTKFSKLKKLIEKNAKTVEILYKELQNYTKLELQDRNIVMHNILANSLSKYL